uniref:Protein kinase domain-containing protein n=1 Tax=Plectus sambesii TaxID=2011161 RepID=A0A914ULR2_9BILA
MSFFSPNSSASLGSSLPSIAASRLSVPASITHPPSASSRWSYEPTGSVITLPMLDQRVRANSDTAGVAPKKKKKRKPRGATSVDRNNNVKDSYGSKRRRRAGTKEQADKERMNEGVVKESTSVQEIAGRQDISKLYDIGNKIGDGNFATVSAALRKGDGTKWAIKDIDKRKVKGKVYYIENEVEVLLKCTHPNICRLREAFQSPQAYYLVLELIDNGDLFDAIKTRGAFSERLAAQVVGDVASALSYLHTLNVVHRDVKPENLLLTNDMRVKIADFGLACKVLGPLYRVCGTPTYVAPDILREQGYGLPVDVWSLGIITHVMLVGYAPFRNQDRAELFRMIQKGVFSLELPGWNKVSDGAKEVVQKMLTVNAEKRISAHQLMRTRWIRKQRQLLPGLEHKREE